MSLPPVTVHIKRKATDEPVDFLRVHEPNGKRQRREFVFSRQTRAQEAGALGSGAKESTGNVQPTAPQTNSILQSAPQNATPTSTLPVKLPRRFHISRSSTPTPSTESVLSGRVEKRTTIFVERRARAKDSPSASSSPFTPALTPDSAQTPSQKKPGQAARTSKLPSNNNPLSSISQLAPERRNVRLPSGLIAPWSLDDQQLVDEMQAYTLQEIGHSIAEADATKPGGSPAPTPTKKPSKFKPKIPKLRYHERHPEEFVNNGSNVEVEELVEDMDDDSEYIIETYIRIPAGAMEVDMNAEKNIGFLVLDGQSDIEEFYSAETESDEDEDYDEEDENAENHYSADYPDEEVESDDEYDRNPYQYADDDDDAAFSDDNDGTKYPWKKKPAWLRKTNGSDDEDDDTGD